ncbi:MAG: aldehyde ferredoxin oxidoreductase family protein [Deltaproteobacteria bacterium]|nr:aldehyde ferredoxin oxidoreductase family protein [Candidatus Zymogenaceae bacterium]
MAEETTRGGYWNRILRVNLTEGSHRVEELDDGFMRTYLGGRSLGLFFLLKETAPNIDPLSEENLLILANGAVTGAPGPAIPRFTAVAKSPLTGGLAASEAGGFWGPELKFAGYDALIVEGKSKSPVYLWITDTAVEIRPADSIWGTGAKPAQEAIREEVGEQRARVLIIGQAGENLVRYANLGNDLGHFNGRNGLGAVMGSKNLKAVAVKGSKKLPLADPKALKNIAKEFAQTFKDNPIGNSLFEYGTTIGVNAMMAGGALPTNNWDRGILEGGENLFCNKYNEEILKDRKGCFACPIRCKRVIEVTRGDISVDSEYGGPEYETIAALGSNVGINDLAVVAKANELANHFGIDSISLGMAISFAIKCYEEEILTDKDTGGMELSFGDGEMLLKLIEMTAHRDGIGDLLAEGQARMAKKIGKGSEKYTITIKGQEVPMHDIRTKTGVGLGYVVSDIGADHLVAPHDSFFTVDDTWSFGEARKLGLTVAVDALDLSEQKAKNYVIISRYARMLDVIGGCFFGFAPRGPMSVDTMLDMIKSITGWEVTIHELLRAGDRSIVLSRIYNFREGFSKEDDCLPDKYTENMVEGPFEGTLAIDPEKFYRYRDHYYRLMGWSVETAYPTDTHINELGLVEFL